MFKQLDQIKEGVDFLISTPGRLVNMIKTNEISLSRVQSFVIDECDKMLNLGMIADLVEIWDQVPRPQFSERIQIINTTRIQTMLFSATLVEKVRDFIKRIAPKAFVVDLNDQMQVAQGGLKKFSFI